MTALALVTGVLHRDPQAKMSRGDKPYALATVRVGQGQDAQWWQVMAFGDENADELLSLKSGDGVSVSGSMKADMYQPSGGKARVSLTVFADKVIALKRQKRDATKSNGNGVHAGQQRDGAPFNDEVRF